MQTNRFQRYAASAVAAGSLLFYAMAVPAFATTIQVSGNGASSSNTAGVTNTQSTTVTQSNDANITNTIHVDATTGGNTSSDNTGGNTTVSTGGASSNVTVDNNANSNVVNGVGCGSCVSGASVVVAGNGADSTNTAEVSNSNDNAVFQTNNANINNNVNVGANTGHNDASDNTGGDTRISTGNTNTTVSVSNAANANVANLNSANAAAGDNGLSATISGNGAGSDNAIGLSADNSGLLVQTNDAYVNNSVHVHSNTGDNSADDNTGGTTSGGDVTITTGSARANVGVDNMLNFNSADLGNCCLTDGLSALIKGNGSYSDNMIEADLSNGSEAFQTNDGTVHNPVTVNGKTGYNSADDNTAGILGMDPSTSTGNSDAVVTVSTSSNMNAFGNGAGLSGIFSGLGGNLSLNFDLGQLLNALGSLGLHISL